MPVRLLQELLNRIPFPKVRRPWRFLRSGKYAILAVFVVALPLLATNAVGRGDPAFCKDLCPAGTLEAGLPLVSGGASLQRIVGALYTWKVAVLVAVVALCLAVYRFFCRAMCPLGAISGLCNRYSWYPLRRDASACTG